MNKENILFSIIGVLLGFIIGFLFALNANQRGLAPRPTTTPDAPAVQRSEAESTSMTPGAVADEGAMTEELQDIRQKAKSNPNDFDAQVQAARRLSENRLFDEAIELFLRANQLRPDSYETITSMGNTYFDAGYYESAEKWYTAALAKKPGDVNVRSDLGLTFLFRKPPDMERAIKEFRTSLQSDPNHEQTLIYLTLALSETGQAKEAQATLAKLEQISPNNSALPKLRQRIEAMAGK
ncbi:MAG TPA: tetratricopeptide repeat protein [Pyrinomonadaceae bacterium]